jgi:carotenoid phi-ring synthase / carotenoid chi-ring synthase
MVLAPPLVDGWWIGAALACLGLVGYLAAKPLARWWIHRRLQGYCVAANTVDESRPLKVVGERRVAIVGSGLAGLGAALTLARRGYQVTVFEKAAVIGGKIRSEPIQLLSGETVFVSHGYHAFFRHYYNLNRFLDGLGLRKNFGDIGDYAIMSPGGEKLSFRGLERTPGLNLLALKKRGFFRWRDVLFGPAKHYLSIFLEYDEERTFQDFDGISFAEFCRKAQLPTRLRLAFNTFSRAFFAEEDRMSLAELTKCFHFYYLSHDEGLIYDYPTKDYEASILAPVRDALTKEGATLRCRTPVSSLAIGSDQIFVNQEPFDACVLATDVAAAKCIVENSMGVPKPLIDALSHQRPGQRYAVLRLWADRDIRADVPGFVVTDRVQILDAVAALHRLEDESKSYFERTGRAVLELHSYAVPDDVPDAAIENLFRTEVLAFFPELEGWSVFDAHLQIRGDFSAFHVGLHQHRPWTRVPGTERLLLAGDWVRLPFPAMLMEGALSSGILAANQIFDADGIRQEPLHSVPNRGLAAGRKSPRVRRRWIAEHSV